MNLWKFKLKNAGNGFMVSEDDANLCDVFMTNDPKIAETRARLIAAAPELLEACKAVLAYLDKLELQPDPDYDPDLSRLRKQFHALLREKLEPAIAKAEGQS